MKTFKEFLKESVEDLSRFSNDNNIKYKLYFYLSNIVGNHSHPSFNYQEYKDEIDKALKQLNISSYNDKRNAYYYLDKQYGNSKSVIMKNHSEWFM